MAKKESNWKFICINFLIALVVVVGLVIAVHFWTKKYTDHGNEIEVPQITGLYLQEAEFLLKNTHLRLEIVDSMSTNNENLLGTIAEQNPVALTHVKEGRAIYVVVFSNKLRQVVLPELHDVSYRQAESVLNQLGLKVEEIIYEPSEYKDLVLDLRIEDESLETGTMLPVGTALTMVVGQGQGSEMLPVPDVVGLPLIEARSMLLANHFTLGSVEYDDLVTDDNKDDFVVYLQQPQSGNSLLEGSSVHVKLSLDKEKVVTAGNMNGDDDFF